ncbi:hypothetical protein MNBD_GAMMA15-808 [hydrothermal vent metagenome]|uniref:Lipoprotein n=1 Tax=hydrothermal vent metagenome TaxID=652676 RepID=A0A3B0ZBC6_9ZZZZ
MSDKNIFSLPASYKIAVIMSLVFSIAGCKESSFELSPESRLPKWIEVEASASRNDYKLTMDYYLGPKSAEAVFKLYDLNGKKKMQLKGDTARYPLKLKNPPSDYPKNYPSYEVITINGVTDIVEHRKMEPIFYMTDDPAVWNELVREKP